MAPEMSSLKTVPQPEGPPATTVLTQLEKPPPQVVPYMLPAESRTNPPKGYSPSFATMPSPKLCSTVSVPEGSSLNTVPAFADPPSLVVP